MCVLSIANATNNFLQMIAVLFVFVCILIVTYFVTRWIGTVGQTQYGNRNIRVIEGCRVGPNKMVQIVKVGSKFYVLGVGKDEISYIGEMEEEELSMTENTLSPLPEFREILAKAKEKVAKNKNKK
ncbi:MAG: flagellar biosynthetic protein FliO [Lachnospiraceae bacterium]|nr:flagellar biosynthetic protein FliO [Lachnospiraceae bacterium]